MDIQQLIYFVTVAKTGTYVAASRQLYISQPALSKSIKKLENEFGTHLFVQVDKKIVLTDTGKILFDGLIADFSVEYPDITIDLCGHGSKHVKELVSGGKIEIGACIQPPEVEDSFCATPLMHDKYFLLVSKDNPLTERTSVRYRDLQDELFYMLNNEYTMTQITKANCHKAGFDPIIKLIVNRTDIMGDLVAKGQGVAVIAGGRWRFENNPDLKTLDLEDGDNDFDIVMITKKDAYLSYPAKYFRDFCKKRCPSLSCGLS